MCLSCWLAGWTCFRLAFLTSRGEARYASFRYQCLLLFDHATTFSTEKTATAEGHRRDRHYDCCGFGRNGSCVRNRSINARARIFAVVYGVSRSRCHRCRWSNDDNGTDAFGGGPHSGSQTNADWCCIPESGFNTVQRCAIKSVVSRSCRHDRTRLLSLDCKLCIALKQTALTLSIRSHTDDAWKSLIVPPVPRTPTCPGSNNESSEICKTRF